MANREAISTALLALVQGAYAWNSRRPVSRKLMLWDKVPPDQRPAAFLFEGQRSKIEWSNDASFKSTKMYSVIVYTNSRGDQTIGATVLNNILDALENAINTPDNDMIGRNTLGGLVYSCRIDGEVLGVPGDIDGDGILLVPVRVMLPQT